MSDELVRERRGNVLVARLDRPEARNALDAAVSTRPSTLRAVRSS